jgi:hypothetical protein
LGPINGRNLFASLIPLYPGYLHGEVLFPPFGGGDTRTGTGAGTKAVMGVETRVGTEAKAGVWVKQMVLEVYCP